MSRTEDLAELVRAVETATRRQDLILLLTANRDQHQCSVRVCNTDGVTLNNYLNLASLILWRLLLVAEQAFPDSDVDVSSMAMAMGNIVADATERHKEGKLDKHTANPVRPSGFALFLNAKEVGALQHLFEKIGEDGLLTPQVVAALRSPIKQVTDISRKIRGNLSNPQQDQR